MKKIEEVIEDIKSLQASVDGWESHPYLNRMSNDDWVTEMKYIYRSLEEIKNELGGLEETC